MHLVGGDRVDGVLGAGGAGACRVADVDVGVDDHRQTGQVAGGAFAVAVRGDAATGLRAGADQVHERERGAHVRCQPPEPAGVHHEVRHATVVVGLYLLNGVEQLRPQLGGGGRCVGVGDVEVGVSDGVQADRCLSDHRLIEQRLHVAEQIGDDRGIDAGRTADRLDAGGLLAGEGEHRHRERGVVHVRLGRGRVLRLHRGRRLGGDPRDFHGHALSGKHVLVGDVRQRAASLALGGHHVGEVLRHGEPGERGGCDGTGFQTGAVDALLCHVLLDALRCTGIVAPVHEVGEEVHAVAPLGFERVGASFGAHPDRGGRCLGGCLVAAGFHLLQVRNAGLDAVGTVELGVEGVDLGAGLGERSRLGVGQVGAAFGGGGDEDRIECGLGRGALVDLGLQLGAQNGEEIGHGVYSLLEVVRVWGSRRAVESRCPQVPAGAAWWRRASGGLPGVSAE